MVGHSEGQAEVIRQDLLRVPGVKKINILRERPEQISPGSPYAKLATLGLSGQDIVAALQRQNTVTRQARSTPPQGQPALPSLGFVASRD